MSKVLLPLAEGFEEIEAVTIIDVLRRAEVDVTTAGLGSMEIRGAHGVSMQTDTKLQDVADEIYDAVVLPGGMPGSSNLAEDATLEKILSRHSAAGKILSAICAAPTVLSKYGYLKGKKATAYPSFDEKLEGCELAPGSVVRDGKITTSRGPGTAMEFSLDLVEQLRGKDTRSEIAQGLLYQ